MSERVAIDRRLDDFAKSMDANEKQISEIVRDGQSRIYDELAHCLEDTGALGKRLNEQVQQCCDEITSIRAEQRPTEKSVQFTEKMEKEIADVTHSCQSQLSAKVTQCLEEMESLEERFHQKLKEGLDDTAGSKKILKETVRQCIDESQKQTVDMMQDVQSQLIEKFSQCFVATEATQQSVNELTQSVQNIEQHTNDTNRRMSESVQGVQTQLTVELAKCVDETAALHQRLNEKFNEYAINNTALDQRLVELAQGLHAAEAMIASAGWNEKLLASWSTDNSPNGSRCRSADGRVPSAAEAMIASAGWDEKLQQLAVSSMALEQRLNGLSQSIEHIEQQSANAGQPSQSQQAEMLARCLAETSALQQKFAQFG